MAPKDPAMKLQKSRTFIPSNGPDGGTEREDIA
jgi:hypothetical protein